MTDRIKGLTVTLAENMRADDAQTIIDAIAMLRGVINVVPLIASSEDHFARVQAKHELREQLWNLLK